MAINRGYDRPFFIMGGAVKTTGGSLNLAKGELALVDQSQTSENGVKVVTTTAGKPKNKKDFALRVGVAGKEPNRSYSDKDESTMPFSLAEVVGLKVSAPKQTEQTVDELVIGYDGINADTAFKFTTGDAYFRVFVEVEGGAIDFRGARGCKETVAVNINIPQCDPFNDCEECDNCSTVDCRDITLEAIKQLRRRELSGGARLEEFVEITPVFSCDNEAVVDETPYSYYCLEVCDTGDDEALALISTQYEAPVIRTDRTGSVSKYQVFLPSSSGAPNDYAQTLASIIKGCEDCPAGYTATPEGVLYAFTVEDDGSNQSALFTALPGYVANTVTKSGNNAGVGFYTAILDNALTDAEVATLLAGAAPRNTITLRNLGNVVSMCENDTVTETAWVECGTCNVTEEQYKITLPDTKCGDNRLAELQLAYPDLDIALSLTGFGAPNVTLTGTSGTMNITIDGTDYLATFATDLTTTAANFVTAHATALLAEGITVTSAGAVLSFANVNLNSGDTWSFTNASGNLNGSITSIDEYVVTGGCKTEYTTTVVSNIVCEECDPIYKDFYVTKAPESFDNHQWTKVPNPTVLPNGNCLCGIKFKGKTFVISADEALRDIAQFTEDSVRVRVSAGYPEEIAEGIGRLPTGVYQPEYISRWIPRTHLAGNLRDLENEGRNYFLGTRYRNEYLSRVLRGEASNMADELKQYVQYTLQIQPTTHAQSFGGRISESMNYDFFVEVGRHQDVETLLNNIAANAGVETVQAFGA